MSLSSSQRNAHTTRTREPMQRLVGMFRKFVFSVNLIVICQTLLCPIYLPNNRRPILNCSSNCSFSHLFGKTDSCLGVYFNYSGQILIKQLGVLHSDEQCLTIRQCFLEVDQVNSKSFSCCCSTDNCTLDWQVMPMTTSRPNLIDNSSVIIIERDSFSWKWIVLATGCLIGIILIVIFVNLCRSLQDQKKKIEEKSFSESSTFAEQLFFTAQQPITGKNSVVYKANSDNDTVALKVYTQTNALMWKNEVSLLKAIKHESIITLLSEGHYASHLYLVLPYYEHGTLQSYLRRTNQTLSLERCLHFLRSIISAVSYLHLGENDLQTTIIHRDIKSSNILVCNDNLTLCLIDFGAAFALPSVLNKNDFVQIGTMRYMAPELLEGVITHTREALCSVDMYALALVMWEIVSQCDAYPMSVYRPPFEEYLPNNLEELPISTQMYNIVVARRLRPTLLRHSNVEQQASIMQELSSLIEACWTTDAEIRMTAQTLAFKLNQLISLFSR